MHNAYFDFAAPHNEPVMSFAPGSPERAALKQQLAAFKAVQLDIPMYIGGKEVRTGKTVDIRPRTRSNTSSAISAWETPGHVKDAYQRSIGGPPAMGGHTRRQRAAVLPESGRTARHQIPRAYQCRHHAGPEQERLPG